MARHAGALDDWPALALWRSEYLAQVAGGLQVSVAITPGGRADAITHVPAEQLPRGASPATSDCGGSRRGASGAVAAGSDNGGDGDSACDGEGGDWYGGAQQSQQWFLTPHTQRMSLAQFFALARHSRAQGSSYAPYVQVCVRWVAPCGGGG